MTQPGGQDRRRGHDQHGNTRHRASDCRAAFAPALPKRAVAASDVQIITKVRVSLNPDRAKARAKLRQVLTFYNIADHYRDMLKASGFETEVNAVQEAFRPGASRPRRK